MNQVVINARAPGRRGLPAAAFLTLSSALWAASLAAKGSIAAVAVAVGVAAAGLVLAVWWRRRFMAQSLWLSHDSVSLRSARTITKVIARPDSIQRSLVHYQRHDPGVDTLIIRNRRGDGLRLTAVWWPIDEVELTRRGHRPSAIQPTICESAAFTADRNSRGDGTQVAGEFCSGPRSAGLAGGETGSTPLAAKPV